MLTDTPEALNSTSSMPAPAKGPANAADTDRLLAYLGRLTGEQPSAETPMQLRSVHRAALASWTRKQGVPVRLELLSSTEPFTVGELLGNGVASPSRTAGPPAAAAGKQNMPLAAGAGGQAILGVGLDIEEVENLPEATDYREHPFFEDNFTPAEIAHAIRQPDVRASLCGTWAAKEAVLKSGLVSSGNGSLKDIEIIRDRAGRPLFPGAQISISHTQRTAVAMCVALALPASQAEGQVSTPPASTKLAVERGPAEQPAKPQVKQGRWPWSRGTA